MSEHPNALRANPRLDRWVEIEPSGRIAIRTGKVELGQGITTVMAVVAASELRVPLDVVRMVPTDTLRSPDEGYTAGSLSTEQGAPAMRAACALVRTLFHDAAAEAMGVRPDDIAIDDGIFRREGSNEGLSYWDLAGSVDLAVSALDLEPATLIGATDDGSGVGRVDLLPKLTSAAYIQDMRLPGMLFGRALRGEHPRDLLVSFDREAVAKMDGVVAVVVDGAFAGVVAHRDAQAAAAVEAARRSAAWRREAELPDCDEAQPWLDGLPGRDFVVVADDASAAPASTELTAEYARPYLLHASIGPACAVAHWQDGRLTLHTHSQGVYPLRAQMARVFGLDEEAITIFHAHGSGCYGHNAADDVALDAALLARAVEHPVMCLWSRADELSWSPHGAAGRVRLAAGLSETGDIVSWKHEIWSPPHVARPGSGAGIDLLAASQLAESHARSPTNGSAGRDRGGDRNSVPLYRLPARSILYHELFQGPMRSSALRSLGAHLNIFAIESFMDELAAAAGADPVAFRLRHCEDMRAAAVIEAAARSAGWDSDDAGGEGVGRGIAVARYKNSGAFYAVVVRVEVEEKVRLISVHGAVDAGRVVHRDGLLNQVEGGVIQAASWTLREEVRWDGNGFAVRSWENYPVLSFSETPTVATVIIPSQEPSLGAGECATGPTAAAIGNAVAHALGVRVRRMPITPDRLIAAIQAA
jgi:nicotinate dehydrogenase subunit B